MKNTRWLNLQLFAGEGADGAGGAGTAESGATNVTADAEQRLRELGVPEDKIKKRASKVASRLNAHSSDARGNAHADVSDADGSDKTRDDTAESAPQNVSPSEKTKSEDKDGEPTAQTSYRMTWDEIMKDPEYNRQMQSVVQSRLRSAKSAEKNLAKMTPAIELLARKYKLDTKNMDYDALAKAISDDDQYYEERALELGTSVETAKRIDKLEAENERNKAQAERTMQEQRIREHLVRLEEQGEALKRIFPSFDLRRELQNPAFARMTSPNVGISVEDAYYAVHRNEIQSASMKVASQKAAEKISNSIQAGSRRPNEAGASAQAASNSTFDYRAASREQREDLKKRIRAAAARGEKLYPGQ